MLLANKETVRLWFTLFSLRCRCIPIFSTGILPEDSLSRTFEDCPGALARAFQIPARYI